MQELTVTGHKTGASQGNKEQINAGRLGDAAGTNGSRRAASTVAGGRAAGQEPCGMRDFTDGANHIAEQFAHIPAHLMEAYGPGTATYLNIGLGNIKICQYFTVPLWEN
jgi:hypothetical protein